MKVLLNCVWIFLIFRGQIAYCELHSQDANDELVFAQVIYRHGNRTILYTYPNDPYKDESNWPGGYGQITNAGKRRQYELGRYLRKRYTNLIGSEYSVKNVYIRSSDTDRTLVSALSNAAGMFPPSSEHRFKSNLIWQPIPIHTIKLEDDYLVYQSTPCPRGDKEIKEYHQSPEIVALARNYTMLFQYLEENSGKEVKTFEDAAFFNDPLNVENFMGFTLPDWAQSILDSSNHLLDYFAGIAFGAATQSTHMKKTKAGFLIREIFDRFRNKTLSLLQPDRKLWIYSAHDNTIINVLNSLNLYDTSIPPFAASLHFELYRRDSKYYVQLFYRKNEFEDVPPLEFPQCGTKCSLDELYKLYAEILPSDSESYDSLCQIPT